LGQAFASGRWIVAVVEKEDGSLGGCMYLQCVDKVPSPGSLQEAWGYVTNAFISPELRGAGIGKSLLSLLIDTGRERNLELLLVWPSEEATSFYRRAGFRSVLEVHATPGDEPPLEMLL
jgi:ribosomal protein S18 acetylase RimI-like enzyme